ncbi:branched-chain amino acid aminotransferase [Fodinibius halophilus]|uniref:Branched-chain-amino-acid aminotransferase n=1 Tax=Fodinibius halophilus TaxID=1736908 RepID=A0A6M1T6K4_9BACT|nr:branched-chain amino acid aminotransferase [Fodinibius halophilus]NGP89767.1 branched-chain amino acid aminotransferase [Fodinibius halophilus]
MTTKTALKITKISNSRLTEVNLDDPGFGRVFSDHMLEVEYSDGYWKEAEIKPFGSIDVTPALNTLHYAQSVFEGMKAYYIDEETINLFRPEQNYERMARSCERMCIPVLDKETFMEGLTELIKLDHKWVPKKDGNTLYIRPLACAFDPVISASIAENYRFFIMTSPVGAYYNKAVRLTSSQKYVRAAKGGVGFAKASGNYAASFYPAKKAQENGFDQVLWLDAKEHKYVEEVGTMNIFFVIDGVLVTPELSGTILPGITRDSILQLADYWDMPFEERRLTIDEVMKAGREGVLDEVFGAGTAAVISPVKEVHHDGESVTFDTDSRGPIGQKLYDTLTGIQQGRIDDPFGWAHPVKVG